MMPFTVMWCTFCQEREAVHAVESPEGFQLPACDICTDNYDTAILPILNGEYSTPEVV